MHAPLVVLGGGPGGYAAAFMAADLGMEVTLVEKDTRLGGTCLLRGCIPSKALLHVGRVVAEVREMQDWGVHFSAPKIDIEAVRDRKEKVIDALTGGLAQLAKRRNVRVVQGQGMFTASNTLEVIQKDAGSQTITFDHCILASGSRPARIPAFDIGSSRVMDSTGALQLEDIPESLLVVGGGYIGLEMGTVYAELGSQVSVVELTDSLLPGADRDLVKPLHKRLGGLFEAIRLNTKVTGLKDIGNGVEVSFEGPEGQTTKTFSRVLVAVGRRPNSDGIGLENTNVVVDAKGFVEVDKQQHTADSHVLAIGDVCGEPMLAHRASHQGKVAVESLHGEPALFEPRAIPAVVFTDPEIAWAGLTEHEAELSGQEVEVSRYPWAASGRAHALGRIEGMTKMLVDPETEQVLGVGIVGSGAGELIAEGALAIEMGCTARDLSETIHPHPTLGETVAFSAENYFGLATEIFRPRAASSAQ
ncbi:MAG: dihydrolipoyl dehydrogenase [Planctomycetaceae bacterium]|jgi:dihydrolipoamide dehydrogenase|nr:dihydrolipoyl dehydrogenase [Planctomycetaceae bacterium]